MDYIIYIYGYFLSAIILYLFMIDIKKFKDRLYYEINNEIWIKIYCLISILVIHLIWLFSILFLNYNDKSVIYGLPYFLILPYILYLATDLRNNETIASKKINKYLNHLMTFYLVIIILISIIPNSIKRNIINIIKNFIDKYL